MTIFCLDSLLTYCPTEVLQFIMECLVDDTMNSNILSSCPTCALDSSSSFTSSRELYVQCDHCKSVNNSTVMNNNPMLQTHRDFVPFSSSLTRPRCCSCLEKSSSIVTSSEVPESVDSLDIPASRPRSSSSPNQHSHSGQPLSVEPSSATSSICQNTCSDSTQSSQVENSHNFQGSLPFDHSGASSEHCSASVYSQELSSDTSDKNEFILNSDTLLRDERTTKDIEQQLCQNCGGVSFIGNDKLENPDLTFVSTNLNAQQSPAFGEDISSPSSSSIVLTTSSTETINTSPVFTQSDESSKRVSPWGRKPREPLFATGDTKLQTEPSTFKHCVEASTEDVDILKHDTTFLKTGFDSPSLYLTTSQIISHNMELNRITTAASRRTQQSTKSSRVIHRNLRLGAATSRPTRHSLHSTSGCPRIVTPDSPLPTELFYQLHDLDHGNEDLSAEVVYSLHFRDYQIKDLLGKGISSTVRRVTEKSTGAEFAVKIIDISGEKGELAQVEQVKKDTFREIKILRMCAGHSNIIELHDVFETPTFIFLVFEICKKGELFDYLTSVVSLSEKRTRIFMRQLIEAVAFIHDKNIVHRDLKPENILLDDNLNIKVSDFGFATVIEPGEELTELCGTPGYLAPEVLAHSMYENVSGYGKEVDMWACGVIMYTLLCGAPPFWNRRQMMMLRAIMNAEYTFNSPEWDDITDAPKNLIQKLLLVNPKDRLTAKEALKHPFFHSQIAEEKKFQARRKFRAAVTCVVFYLRLSFFYKHPPPISVDMVRSNPYGIKLMRKVIDTCAFSMYKHWVKRVDNQNRAALFEHTLRDDWRHTPMNIDGIK